MKYMLDTNICIYAIKNKPAQVLEHLLQQDPAEVCISAVTYAELTHGVEKSAAKDRNRAALLMFLAPISVLDFTAAAAEKYGQLRADVERAGTPVGTMDLLIAGHAEAEGLTLVTNNEREFRRIRGLEIENWAV